MNKQRGPNLRVWCSLLGHSCISDEPLNYILCMCNVFTQPFHEVHCGRGEKEKKTPVFHLNIFHQKHLDVEF